MKQAKPEQLPLGTGSNRRLMDLEKLAKSMGDFSGFETHDTAIKFWLPQPAIDALRELCGIQGNSLSEALRQFLFQHCYGIYAYAAVLRANASVFKDPDAEDVFFCRSDDGRDSPPAKTKKRSTTYWVPELGKNVAPIKVWVPSRLRDDLQILANHVAVKLSQYLREIVISRLLGHGTLPYRLEMLDATPLPAADAWCEDQIVPMRETSESEYRNNPGGESRLDG